MTQPRDNPSPRILRNPHESSRKNCGQVDQWKSAARNDYSSYFRRGSWHGFCGYFGRSANCNDPWWQIWEPISLWQREQNTKMSFWIKFDYLKLTEIDNIYNNQLTPPQKKRFILFLSWMFFSPPIRWGLLEFMWVHRRLRLLLLLLLLRPPLRNSYNLRSVFGHHRTSIAKSNAQCSLPDPTAMSCAQCSLPDANRDLPRPVFASRPQPRSSTPSVRYRTPAAIMRPVFATGPQPRSSAPSVRYWTLTAISRAQCSPQIATGPQPFWKDVRSQGYRISKSCEHPHVVKAGPVQSLHAVFCSCLQTRLKRQRPQERMRWLNEEASRKHSIANDVDLAWEHGWNTRFWNGT